MHLRFGLPATLPAPIKKLIKRADGLSAWAEATQIAGFTTAEADRYFGAPPPGVLDGVQIAPRPPAEVRADFIARHRALEQAAFARPM